MSHPWGAPAWRGVIEPSVNSVTYGVSYGIQKAIADNGLTLWIVPKGANLGSERCEFGFRKVRTKICLWVVPDSAKNAVPEQANLAYRVTYESAA